VPDSVQRATPGGDMGTIPSTSAAAGPRHRAPSSGLPSSRLEALLDLAACSAAAGVLELTLDVSALDLTDPPTWHVLIDVAAALQAPGQRLTLVGLTVDQLDDALRAASLPEVFVLRAAMHGSPGDGAAPGDDSGAAGVRRSRLVDQGLAS
jgi:hypothetical protein